MNRWFQMPVSKLHVKYTRTSTREYRRGQTLYMGLIWSKGIFKNFVRLKSHRKSLYDSIWNVRMAQGKINLSLTSSLYNKEITETSSRATAILHISCVFISSMNQLNLTSSSCFSPNSAFFFLHSKRALLFVHISSITGHSIGISKES